MRNAKLVAMVPTDYVKKFRERDDLDGAPEPFEKGEFWCDYKL